MPLDMSWEQHLTWCLPHLVIHGRLKMVGKYNHISHTWRNMGPYSYIHCKLHSSWSFIWWKKITHLISLITPPPPLKKKQTVPDCRASLGYLHQQSERKVVGHLKPWEALVSPKGYKNPLRTILNPWFWRWGRITHRATYSREVFVMKSVLVRNFANKHDLLCQGGKTAKGNHLEWFGMVAGKRSPSHNSELQATQLKQYFNEPGSM